MDKELIHIKGILHKSVHLLIINNLGQVYVRKRKLNELRYPGLFTTTLGTHVKKGDDYFSTIKKELSFQSFLNYIGEFRVQDKFENELNGLFVIKSDIKYINKEFQKDRQFLYVMSLDIDEITPHLREAYSLYFNNISGRNK